MYSSRPQQGSSAAPAKKAQVRELWKEFENSVKPRRAELDKQIQALSKLDSTQKNGPRNAINLTSNAQTIKSIKAKYTERFRDEWDKKLTSAKLTNDDWGNMTNEEQQSVINLLGGDDDASPPPQQYQVSPLPTPTSSTLNPRPFHATPSITAPPSISYPAVPVAPSFSASTRSSNLSSSSYALVNPAEFNSEPEDEGLNYFTVATSYDSHTSEDDDDAPQPTASRASAGSGFARPPRHRSGTISQTRGKTSYPPSSASNPRKDGASGLFGEGFDREDHSLLASTKPKHQPLPPSAQVHAKSTKSKSEPEPSLPEPFPHANDDAGAVVVLASPLPPTHSGPSSLPFDTSSSSSPDSTSSSSASSSKPKPRDIYLGPILYDANDDPDDDDFIIHHDDVRPNADPSQLDSESAFEKYAVQIRLQKIFEYHEAALAADCRLALQIHQARRVHKDKGRDGQLEAFDVGPMVEEHQKRLRQIQMEKEEERKSIVRAERTKRRAEMQARQEQAQATKSARRLSRTGSEFGSMSSSQSQTTEWLQDLQSTTDRQIQDSFNLDRILAEDPDLRQLMSAHTSHADGKGNDAYLRFSSTSSSPVPESPVYPSSLPMGLGQGAPSVSSSSFLSASGSVSGNEGITGGGFWRPPGASNPPASVSSASVHLHHQYQHANTQPVHLRSSASSASIHSIPGHSAPPNVGRPLSLFGNQGADDSDDDDEEEGQGGGGPRTAIPGGFYPAQEQHVQRGRQPSVVRHPGSTQPFGSGPGHNQQALYTPGNTHGGGHPQSHGRSHSLSFSHSQPHTHSHHAHSQPASSLTSPTTESHFSIPFAGGRPTSHSGPNSASASVSGSPPKNFPAWKLKSDLSNNGNDSPHSAIPPTPVSAGGSAGGVTPSWDMPLSRRPRGVSTNLNPALPPPSASAAWSTLNSGAVGGAGNVNGGRSTPLASAWNVRSGSASVNGGAGNKTVIVQPKPTLPPKRPSNNPFTDSDEEEDEEEEEEEEEFRAEYNNTALVRVQDKGGNAPAQGRRGSIGAAGSLVGSLGKSLFGGVLGGGSGNGGKGKMVNGSSPLADNQRPSPPVGSTTSAKAKSTPAVQPPAPTPAPAGPGKKLNKKQRLAANKKAAAAASLDHEEPDLEPESQPEPQPQQPHHAHSTSMFGLDDEKRREQDAMENMWASMGAGRGGSVSRGQSQVPGSTSSALGRGAGMAPVPPVPIPASRVGHMAYPSAPSTASSGSGFNPHRHGLGPHGVALSTSATSSAARSASGDPMSADDKAVFDFMTSYRSGVGGVGDDDLHLQPRQLPHQPPSALSHLQGGPRQRMNSSDSSWGEATTPRPAHRIPGKILGGMSMNSGPSLSDPREPGADLGMHMGSLGGRAEGNVDDFALPPTMTIRPGLFDKQQTTAAELLNKTGNDGNDGTIRGVPSGWGIGSGGSGSSAAGSGGIRSLWGQKPASGVGGGQEGGQSGGSATPATWMPGSFGGDDMSESGGLWGSQSAAGGSGAKQGQSSFASQMLRRGNAGPDDSSMSSSEFGSFGSPLSAFSASPLSASTPAANSKIGKGKKALKGRRVEVEVVEDEDGSQLTDSMLPVDSRFLLEPNKPLQHPRPSVAHSVFSSIIDYGDGQPQDGHHDHADGNSSPSASSAQDPMLDFNDPKILKGIQELQQGSEKLSKVYGGAGLKQGGKAAWGPAANVTQSNANESGNLKTDHTPATNPSPPAAQPPNTKGSPSNAGPSTGSPAANGKNDSPPAAWGKANANDKGKDTKGNAATNSKADTSPTTPTAPAPTGKGKRGKNRR